MGLDRAQRFLHLRARSMSEAVVVALEFGLYRQRLDHSQQIAADTAEDGGREGQQYAAFNHTLQDCVGP